MQMTTMPATSALFKSKWNHFITKFSHQDNHKENDHTMYTLCDNTQRKNSDANSVDSIATLADKFRQVIPFFRRRSSTSNISTVQQHMADESTSQHYNLSFSAATTNTTTVSPDYTEAFDKLKSLYTLAVDELNYAIDSQGSSYYSGDLVTAREALNDCANAFMELLLHTTDPVTREGLQNLMAPKLMRLQKKLDTLPEVDED
ncbi:uncharacterized protein B0P05DRAFT_532540 [Gilbertella persicaria]|uniref:uncharacterized protein n=1 Tax=Gilbertella persicaria TaxID=101096 RepID=UPI00222053DC|nr:uncharacterized protein B0P05DRAFT_532540 [Gilbertella persicaria]KAI8086830.1 hypothetical protein B0P05DRAFT_532540 [Gilbertella persicaria]